MYRYILVYVGLYRYHTIAWYIPVHTGTYLYELGTYHWSGFQMVSVYQSGPGPGSESGAPAVAPAAAPAASKSAAAAAGKLPT